MKLMRLCTRASGLVGCAVALSACPPEVRDEPAAEPSPAAARLASSLHVESYADSARFSLLVTNPADQPVELTYPTGQSFDFVVEQNGRELWRWSDDRVFTQAIRQETLGPEETLNFAATWTPPAGAEGEFTVRGMLTTQEHTAEQQARFRLP
jgi:hypothetical protein